MSFSHEKCPVCCRELQHIQRLNKPCGVAGGKTMSFVDSVCNNVKDFNVSPGDYPVHTFFQVTSLYGDCLFESVTFPDMGVNVEVNYIKQKSTILYCAAPGRYPTASGHEVNVITCENTILKFDYPKLEKLINKTKVLAPFL